MKPALIIACVLGVTVFNSCKKNTDPEPDSEKTYLARLTNYLGSMTYTYDDQNRLVTESFITLNASVISNSVSTYSEFNNVGRPTKASYLNPTTAVTTTATMEYDANGRIVKASYFDASGAQGSTYVYTYNGNTAEETIYTRTGAFSQRTTYVYGDNDNLLMIQYYNFTGNLVQTTTYSVFDDKKSIRDLMDSQSKLSWSKNNPTTYTATLFTTSPATTYQYSVVYEYNTDGYPIKMSSTNTTTGLNRVTTYEYFKK